MKKLIWFLFVLLMLISYSYAKKPDPLYLNSEVIDSEAIEQEKQEKKAKKKRIWRRKSPKIEQWQKDKAKMPVTVEEYREMSKETLRSDFDIPKPVFEKNPDFILPEPSYRAVSYNNPPGQRNINVSKLMEERVAASSAILSPDKTKMVYTKSFFYPQTKQTVSAAYYIPVKGFGDAYDILYNTNVVQGSNEPIFTIGSDWLINYQFTTLCPLDFSKDSNKLAFKEKIGSNAVGTWITNIIIYDFKSEKFERLDFIREEIIKYWRINKQIDLKNYLWDVYPMGWDKNNSDRIILYAYAYTQTNPMFLGTWSIDINKKISQLVSIDSADAEIDLNGFGLQKY